MKRIYDRRSLKFWSKEVISQPYLLGDASCIEMKGSIENWFRYVGVMGAIVITSIVGTFGQQGIEGITTAPIRAAVSIDSANSSVEFVNTDDSDNSDEIPIHRPSTVSTASTNNVPTSRNNDPKAKDEFATIVDLETLTAQVEGSSEEVENLSERIIEFQETVLFVGLLLTFVLIGAIRFLLRKTAAQFSAGIRAVEVVSKRASGKMKEAEQKIQNLGSEVVSIQKFSNQIQIDAASKFESIGNEQERIAIDVGFSQWSQSLGLSPGSVPCIRYVPASIYTSEQIPMLKFQRLTQAFSELMAAQGLEPAAELPIVHGSLLKRLWFRTKNIATHEEVVQRAKETEKAIKLQYIEKVAAEVNRIKSETISNLVRELRGLQGDAIIDGGSLIGIRLARVQGNPLTLVQALSESQTREFHSDMDLQTDPSRAFEWLKRTSSIGKRSICPLPET